MMSELHARRSPVGIALVRRVFRQQRDAGRLECLGRGPRARWRRIGYRPKHIGNETMSSTYIGGCGEARGMTPVEKRTSRDRVEGR